MDRLVFLAYSFKDTRRVRQLRAALELHDLRVWPPDGLLPGTLTWQRQVDARLDQAVCVVLVVSNDTMDSKWALMATEGANQRGLPILPVVIDGKPGHILLVETSGDDWFDLRWSRNYVREVREMVALIRHYLGADSITIEAGS